MPQVTVPAPTNLMEMFQSPSMMMGDIAQGQLDQFRRANELNMSQAQQAQEFEKQKQPYELSKLWYDNETTRARLPGIQAQSDVLRDTADLSRATLPEQMNAKRSELLKSVSDNDMSQAETAIRQMAISRDPRVRQQGEVLMQGFKDFQRELLQERERRKTALATTGATIAGQKELEQMRIDAGKYKKNDKYGLSLSQRLDAETDPRKKLGMLVEAAQMAAADGDTESAQAFTARAQAYQPIVQQWLNANPRAGGVDVGAVANLPTIQTPNLVPGAVPQGKERNLSFSTEDQVNQAISAGVLKPGDIVIINGRKARIK